MIYKRLFSLWESSWLAYWLGLPWRCRVRHVPVERMDYEPNTGYLYESWFECERCGNYLSAGVFRG